MSIEIPGWLLSYGGVALVSFGLGVLVGAGWVGSVIMGSWGR